MSLILVIHNSNYGLHSLSVSKKCIFLQLFLVVEVSWLFPRRCVDPGLEIDWVLEWLWLSQCLGIINEVRGGWVPSGQGTSVTDLLTCDNPMSVHYTAPPSPGLTPANPLPADKVQCQASIMMNQCFLLYNFLNAFTETRRRVLGSVRTLKYELERELRYFREKFLKI